MVQTSPGVGRGAHTPAYQHLLPCRCTPRPPASLEASAPCRPPGVQASDYPSKTLCVGRHFPTGSPTMLPPTPCLFLGSLSKEQNHSGDTAADVLETSPSGHRYKRLLGYFLFSVLTSCTQYAATYYIQIYMHISASSLSCWDGCMQRPSSTSGTDGLREVLSNHVARAYAPGSQEYQIQRPQSASPLFQPIPPSSTPVLSPANHGVTAPSKSRVKRLWCSLIMERKKS